MVWRVVGVGVGVVVVVVVVGVVGIVVVDCGVDFFLFFCLGSIVNCSQ